jgi:hypothetical protein
MGDGSFETALRTAVDRLVAQFHPERIILFGSRARGDARADSDMDLLVIFPTLPDHPWETTTAMRRAVGVIGFGKDLFVSDAARFRQRAHLVGTVEEIAHREGVVVHAAS